MTELTRLTIAAARDGLKQKKFSAAELAEAHLVAMERARALNAYVLETPQRAHAMAKASDARIHKGEPHPLEGIPLAIKDMFATEGVRTTAGSRILENFVPTYESTVSAHLWRDGAVLLGKVNNDEFAMGSSNETSALGPVPTPAARSASPRRLPASSASSRPTDAARAGVSWRLPLRSTKPGRSHAQCATPQSCCARWRDTIPKTPPAPICRCPTTRPRSAGR